MIKTNSDFNRESVSVPKGTEIEIIDFATGPGYDGQWLEVRLKSSGSIEYIPASFVSEISESAAAALGAMTSDAKKKSSAANGRKGGRPRKNTANIA